MALAERRALHRIGGRSAVLVLLAAAALLAGCQSAPSADPRRDGAHRAAAAAAGEEAILLPEPLAVELPRAGMTELSPDAPPLRELLAGATAGGLRVTHDRSAPLRIGPTEVTWTAWEGVPHQSGVRGTRRAWVYVFPHGTTPVGVTHKYNALAANHSAKIVRDATGRIHMAWLETRPGPGGRRVGRVVYRRAAQDETTGRLTFETDVMPVSEPGGGGPGSYLAVEASPSAVHLAWFGGRTTLYRRLVFRGGVWSFERVRDTGAPGSAHDTGPDMGVRGDDEIHIVTPTGHYAVSTNGGAGWSRDRLPAPGPPFKNTAIAVDREGHAHVVFTVLRRHLKSWSSDRPNGGYWELAYARRRPGGGWVDAQNVLAASPAWADAGRERDVLADWADIAVDAGGSLHVAFHGTANTGIYGRDEAHYVRRPAVGPGAWGPWEAAKPLHPIDRAGGTLFSFAPALSVAPEGDVVVALVFFELRDYPREIFDSDAVIVRGGIVEGPPIPLSQMARRAARWQDALGNWFPSAAPRLHRSKDGRVWLDTLQVAETPERHASPHPVVYQGLDLTDRMARESRPAR
jgi:hypothetical protein